VNGAAWGLLAAFFAVAALDWVAVAIGSKRLEYVCKPGCMAVLMAVAAVIDPADTTARVVLIVALALSTLGDVFLMLPVRPPGSGGFDGFVAGLAAFLLAHLAYVAAFAVEGASVGGLVVGAIVAGAIVATVGVRVVAAVRVSDQRELAVPVEAYVAVISVMTMTAVGTGDPRAIAGALLFAGSDSLIAWQRFIRPLPHGPLAVIVSYHLAQALLVVSFT
jgi:uncharacterized membrane protein YhhN